MSQQNVETFKRGAEAWNRRDVEVMLEYFDPDVEYEGALPGSLGYVQVEDVAICVVLGAVEDQ
jgi:hypothetical protein